MTSDQYRVILDRLFVKRSQLADALRELGDERPETTINRRLQEIASLPAGKHVPWEVAALVRSLERQKRMALELDRLEGVKLAVATVQIRSDWRRVLVQMATQYPEDVSLDDIGWWLESKGAPRTSGAVRSQIHNWLGEGIVERTARGRYRITTIGADALGVDLAQSNEGNAA